MIFSGVIVGLFTDVLLQWWSNSSRTIWSSTPSIRLVATFPSLGWILLSDSKLHLIGEKLQQSNLITKIEYNNIQSMIGKTISIKDANNNVHSAVLGYANPETSNE
jgi:hypothetical protein